MAKRKSAPKSKKKQAKKPNLVKRTWQRMRRWFVYGVLACIVVPIFGVLLYAFVNPPMTHTIWEEKRRLGGVEWYWADADDISPHMMRAAVAAEDAAYCSHWGFDMAAIRAAIEDGADRGGSTISQQVVKNAYLWQGRSWLRKAIEAAMTPMIEAVWTKRRIIEVYLNIAEFGEGVFGVKAAAAKYYGVEPSELSLTQSARLAVLLPNPKQRDPNQLPTWLRNHAARVADGAATIQADGRASCLED